MTDNVRVEVSPEIVLEGRSVGNSTNIMCSSCHRGDRLREGRVARVYAHRRADKTDWSIAEFRCADCRDGGRDLTHPTLGVEEVIADARLCRQMDVSTQQSQLVLSDIDVCEVSPLDQDSAAVSP